ncbi:MAG: phosphate-starvation-inducible PsiE family protein [Rhodocyclaceae bacterium]|nr:phosphate-starvation-inducible PsiE family protein [Rhodocyclaceae bacterium]MDZ4214689.1 phosphate-starvation-inducible PsiE family protein [Rhodocyclaceae bacterium]
MDVRSKTFVRVRCFFSGGLDFIEYVGLLIIAIATTVAIYQEVTVMVQARTVRLADLLLMFLYLEVLAMIGQYFKTGQLPVRFPLYIAMVALARYLILDIKEMNELRMLSVVAAIFLLTLGVLAIRYGHVRFPYREDADESAPEKRFVKE